MIYEAPEINNELKWYIIWHRNRLVFYYKERIENHSFSSINDTDIVEAMKIKNPNTSKKYTYMSFLILEKLFTLPNAI